MTKMSEAVIDSTNVQAEIPQVDDPGTPPQDQPKPPVE